MWIWIVLAAVLVLIYMLLPNIYAFRGSFAYEKSGLEAAVRLYEKAYKTNRASVSAKLNYALLVLRDERPEEAEKIFNEIVLNPGVPDKKKNAARQYRCMAYIKQERPEEALEDSLELLERYKNSDLYAIAGYAMIMSQKPLSDIMDFCSEAYEYNEDNRDIADNYAVALIMSENYKEAVTVCDKVIKKYRFFPEGHYHKALALVNLEKGSDASDELELLEDCDFNYMTTFDDDDVEKLKQRIKDLENV
jgi:tetratricopeptide (TPR) repeat protein